ncbi:anti-sigma regulatory factor [Occallatibacter riparius]|uniref:Anti-sigma regulatory factor n=1 Tax=Occallatibacter riparius TaxID=1002689 RepID=A0A9J7BXT3_9BACT|nr:anti-sigma regulatory factor [Occallatibacter riparius]UWZ86794.1 anti-sigma regulatory factor [Occallatibacter riparius]
MELTMNIVKRETQPLKNSNDVVLARQKVRQWAIELRFSLVDQTKLVTAASELARNALDHGKGGSMTAEVITSGAKSGLRLVFEDQGPGIPNIDLALKDGYTSASGMGLGLGGSKRLVNEFDIQSEVGKGTKVTVIRWK